jgi:hypothetical protein
MVFGSVLIGALLTFSIGTGQPLVEASNTSISDLIANRDRDAVYEYLKKQLRQPRIGSIGMAELNAIVGLEETRRASVETILIDRFREKDCPETDKRQIISWLVELGNTSQAHLTEANRYLSDNATRPIQNRERSSFVAELITVAERLPPDQARGLCVSVFERISERIGQSDDEAVLTDQIESLMKLKPHTERRQWNRVGDRLLRVIARDRENITRQGDLLVRVLDEMEVSAAIELARKSIPYFLAAQREDEHPEVAIRQAGWLTKVVAQLSPAEIARTGTATSRHLASKFVEALRLSLLVGDVNGDVRLRNEASHITERWKPEDVARVFAAFNPRHVEHLPRLPSPPPATIPEKLSLDGARQILWEYLFAVRGKQVFDHLSSWLPDLVLRGSWAARYYNWYSYGRPEESIYRLAAWSDRLDPIDAVTLVSLALRYGGTPPSESRVSPLLLVESLLRNMERLSATELEWKLAEALPVLLRITPQARNLYHREYNNTERFQTYLRRLSYLCRNVDAATPLREIGARCLVNHFGPGPEQCNVLRRFLDPTDRPQRVREITWAFGLLCQNPTGILGGASVMRLTGRPIPEPISDAVCVELLKHVNCSYGFRRAILDSLEIRHGRKFIDQWAYVRFARDLNLPVDLVSPPKE